MKIRKNAWFVRFGWSYFPVTWKGLLVSLAGIGAILTTVSYFPTAIGGDDPQFMAWVVAIIELVLFLTICRRLSKPFGP